METVALSIIPDKTSPAIHTSQYDEGRIKRFMLYDGPCPYTLSGDEVIELRIRKPNNQTEIIKVENSGDDYIDLTLTNQITDIAGDVYCKFHIDDISTKGFYIKVEPGPARIYTRYADGEIAEFETDLVEDIIKLDVDFEPIQDLHGYDNPWAPGCGKNLLKTSGLSLIPPSSTAFSNSTKRTFSFNSYCLGLSNNNYYQPNKITSYSISENSVVMNSSAKAYGIGVPTKLEVGVRYNLSFVTTGGRIATSFYSLDGTALSFIDNATNNYYFTVPEDTVYVVFVFKVVTNDVGATFSNIQLEKGSSATTWTPYSNICPISGRTTAKIFRNSGNLVDDSIKYVYSSSIVYIGTDGHYNTFLRAGTYRASVDFSGERYGLYCRSADAGNIMICGSNSGAHESTFVIPKDDYYRFWSYYNPSLGTIDVNKIKWVKVELGNATTPYEPYIISPTPVTVNFGQTVYNGTIDYTAQVIRATSKLVKISDYTWVKDSYGFYRTGINDMLRNPDSGKKLDGLISEAYVNRSASQAGSKRVNNSIAAWTNQLRIRDDTYDNATDFVNAMGDTHFLYPLKTPIEIPFSGYTPIPTLKGKNIVYSDSGDVYVGYHTTKQ